MQIHYYVFVMLRISRANFEKLCEKRVKSGDYFTFMECPIKVNRKTGDRSTSAINAQMKSKILFII